MRLTFLGPYDFSDFEKFAKDADRFMYENCGSNLWPPEVLIAVRKEYPFDEVVRQWAQSREYKVVEFEPKWNVLDPPYDMCVRRSRHGLYNAMGRILMEEEIAYWISETRHLQHCVSYLDKEDPEGEHIINTMRRYLSPPRIMMRSFETAQLFPPI